MVITRLKTKNQVTIPKEIIKRLHLKQNELFQVDVGTNFIKLIPVEIKPRYTQKELKAVDKIVEKEKKRAKTIKPDKEFSHYINKIS